MKISLCIFCAWPFSVQKCSGWFWLWNGFKRKTTNTQHFLWLFACPWIKINNYFFTLTNTFCQPWGTLQRGCRSISERCVCGGGVVLPCSDARKCYFTSGTEQVCIYRTSFKQQNFKSRILKLKSSLFRPSKDRVKVLGTEVYREEWLNPKFKTLRFDVSMTLYLKALWVKAGCIWG